MPELPEVETVVQGLQSIAGSHITDVVIHQRKLRFSIPDHFEQTLCSQQIKSITRRAKYIIITLNQSALLVHLGMSGKFVLTDSAYQSKKHDHVILSLDNQKILVFNDPRRFGFMLITDPIQYLQHLGPEPLSSDFDTEYLFSKTRSRKAIKLIIMDQLCVVGVGNIYACEALFLAKISPLREGQSLSLAECETLVNSIKKILTEAILKGGTTLKDYRTADNALGYFQQTLAVYGQKTCLKGHNVIRIKQSGRSTYYCPTCIL